MQNKSFKRLQKVDKLFEMQLINKFNIFVSWN